MGAVAIPLRGAGSTSVLLRRVLTAAILIPAVVWMVAVGPLWVFRTFAIALSAVAAWEFGRLFQRAGRRVQPWTCALCAALVTASFGAGDLGWTGSPVVAVLAGTTALLLARPLWTTSSPASDSVVIGLSSLCYIGVFMGHALLLHQLADGRSLLLFLLIVTWAGETAAYAVGSLVGRHKLAPRISPGKTVEGAVAQFLTSGVAAWVLGGLAPGWSGAETLAAGFMLGTVGQIGDLAESAIKRSVGAKDAGSAMPGHGGLLDRIDGLLFNVPALFYYAGVLGGRA